MSLFGDLKKIFFGAKSIAKHQTELASEAAKEKMDDLAEQGAAFKSIAKDKLDTASEQAKEAFQDLTHTGEALAEQGKEALDDLGDKVFKEAGDLVDKGAELRDKSADWINERLGSLNTSADNTAADLADAMEEPLTADPAPRSPTSGVVDYEAGLVDDPGMSAMPKEPSAASEVANQALDAAAKAGLDAKAAAGRLGDRVMDISEKVGGKILDKGSDFLDKAAEKGADLKEKTADFIDKANDRAEAIKLEEAAEAAKNSAAIAEARGRAFGNEEAGRDTDESLLDGTDSFFDRAAKFADGDYHREGKVRIVDNDDPTKIELTKKGKIDLTGFDDKDGDGDSLIDDVEIEKD